MFTNDPILYGATFPYTDINLQQDPFFAHLMPWQKQFAQNYLPYQQYQATQYPQFSQYPQYSQYSQFSQMPYAGYNQYFNTPQQQFVPTNFNPFVPFNTHMLPYAAKFLPFQQFNLPYQVPQQNWHRQFIGC